MSSKKSPRWSVRFELRPENADHVRLHDYLNQLALDEAASDWIRDTLIAALPSGAKFIKPQWRDNVVYEDVDA